MSAEAELVVALERELAKAARRFANQAADALIKGIVPDDHFRRYERACVMLSGDRFDHAELFRMAEAYSQLMTRYQNAIRSLPAVPTVGGQ